ncbi:uncharacterized protein LOC121412286 [Lytechinus variegatus]|uniref:uncharacterized protein LOC121412286 n=1 Tax=Lytechinus variegatus TaxID=7654 RepID=UPI001BB2AF25|nr:uncharacterized protein LOC121412286 [Lytechinus variegatus]
MAARCIQATWRLYRWHRHDKATLTKFQFCLSKLGLVHPKTHLTNQLYAALFHWREIKKSKTPDETWVKDFVADNTALMLTDVLRKMDNIEDMLMDPSSGEKPKEEYQDDDDDDGGGGGNTLQVTNDDDDEPVKKTGSEIHDTVDVPSSRQIPTAWAEPSPCPHPPYPLPHPVITVQGPDEPSETAHPGAMAGSKTTSSAVLRRITEAELKVDKMYRDMRKELSDIKTFLQRADGVALMMITVDVFYLDSIMLASP